MSTASVTAYRVSFNKKLEERALEAASAEAKALEARLDGLLREADKTLQTYPTLSRELPLSPARRASASLSKLASTEAYRDRLLRERRDTEAYRDQLSKAVNEADNWILATACLGESQRYLQSVSTSSQVRSARDVILGTERHDNERGLQEKREATSRKVSEVFARLTIAPTELARLRKYAADLLSLNDFRTIEVGLTDFRSKAAKAQKSHDARASELREVAALRSDLSGLEGHTVAAVIRELDFVEKGDRALTNELRSRVAATRDDATREADRQYVAGIVVQTLTNLGHEIGSEFATLFTEGGHIHTHRPSWRTDLHGRPEHVVELEVDPAKGMLGAKVMRVGDPDEPAIVYGKDKAAFATEKVASEWCKDLVKLLTTMRKEGIDISVVEESVVKPGVRGERVAILPRKERSSTKVRRTQGRALRSKSP